MRKEIQRTQTKSNGCSRCKNSRIDRPWGTNGPRAVVARGGDRFRKTMICIFVVFNNKCANHLSLIADLHHHQFSRNSHPTKSAYRVMYHHRRTWNAASYTLSIAMLNHRHSFNWRRDLGACGYIGCYFCALLNVSQDLSRIYCKIFFSDVQIS